MTLTEFEKEVAAALRRLPPEWRARLDNVVVTAAAGPTAAQQRRFGPRLLGLYEGVPLTGRGQSYSGAMPDKITLFKDNLEAGCADAASLRRAVRLTVMHEIAHHFGIGDDELKEKGLY